MNFKLALRYLFYTRVVELSTAVKITGKPRSWVQSKLDNGILAYVQIDNRTLVCLPNLIVWMVEEEAIAEIGQLEEYCYLTAKKEVVFWDQIARDRKKFKLLEK